MPQLAERLSVSRKTGAARLKKWKDAAWLSKLVLTAKDTGSCWDNAKCPHGRLYKICCESIAALFYGHKFLQINFSGLALKAVSPACPFHLIGSFQCFSHLFLAHHLSLNGLQPIEADDVDLCQREKRFLLASGYGHGMADGLSDRHVASDHIYRCGTPACQLIQGVECWSVS